MMRRAICLAFSMRCRHSGGGSTRTGDVFLTFAVSSVRPLESLPSDVRLADVAVDSTTDDLPLALGLRCRRKTVRW